MQTSDISFKRHRFRAQIVAHAVWLYLRFNLSLREIEEMLLERGVDVSYGTVRRWREILALACGQSTWHRSRRDLAKATDKRAAKRLLVALMKRYGFVPKRIITDKCAPTAQQRRTWHPQLYQLIG